MLERRILLITLILFSSSISADDRSQVYREVANDLARLKERIDRASEAQTVTVFPKQLKITSDKAVLLAGASENAVPVSHATKGTMYKIIDKASNWYAVALDNKVKGHSSAWVNASGVAPVSYTSSSTEQIKSFADKIYEEILDGVNSFKQKYKDSPYVKVSGFSVNLAIPPSVTVSFEFKE